MGAANGRGYGREGVWELLTGGGMGAGKGKG